MRDTRDALIIAARIFFAAMVLVTATGAGALFVAWPTQTESRSSIYMTVGVAESVEASPATYAVQVAP
jgi:hypothetical protein